MTATPRTQALWMKHHAFSTEEEASEALCDFRDHGNALETELAAERKKVLVLREALENLRDEQNGAPLCTRETEWKEAMDKADAALAAMKEASK